MGKEDKIGNEAFRWARATVFNCNKTSVGRAIASGCATHCHLSVHSLAMPLSGSGDASRRVRVMPHLPRGGGGGGGGGGCRSFIFLPPPSFLFPSATGESTWDPEVFIIIIIIFPFWWRSYNKHSISYHGEEWRSKTWMWRWGVLLRLYQ